MEKRHNEICELCEYVKCVPAVIRGHLLSNPALGQHTLIQDSKTCSNCNAFVIWRMVREG